jgi:hypothetical protein
MSVFEDMLWGLSSDEHGHNGCSFGGFRSLATESEFGSADGIQNDVFGFAPVCYTLVSIQSLQPAVRVLPFRPLAPSSSSVYPPLRLSTFPPHSTQTSFS